MFSNPKLGRKNIPPTMPIIDFRDPSIFDVKFVSMNGDVYGSKAILFHQSTTFQALCGCEYTGMLVVEERDFTSDQLINWLRFSHKSLESNQEIFKWGSVLSKTYISTRLKLEAKYNQTEHFKYTLQMIQSVPTVLEYNLDIYHLLLKTTLLDNIREVCFDYAIKKMSKEKLESLPKDYLTQMIIETRLPAKRKASEERKAFEEPKFNSAFTGII